MANMLAYKILNFGILNWCFKSIDHFRRCHKGEHFSLYSYKDYFAFEGRHVRAEATLVRHDVVQTAVIRRKTGLKIKMLSWRIPYKWVVQVNVGSLQFPS